MQDYTRGIPVIAVALVGGSRTQIIRQQITNIRTKNDGQKVPMVIVIDSPKTEVQKLAELFNISVSIDSTNPHKKGE